MRGDTPCTHTLARSSFSSRVVAGIGQIQILCSYQMYGYFLEINQHPITAIEPDDATETLMLTLDVPGMSGTCEYLINDNGDAAFVALVPVSELRRPQYCESLSQLD